MLTLLALLTTIGSGAPAAGQPLAVDTNAAGAPVRLWMNNDRRFRPGDRVRLQVDADVDGYLLVLNYDAEGRVRVLFPLDPRDDAKVQAGRRYEVRDGDSQAAFRASGDGTGLIFTAVSQDPWRFDQVVLGGRWDYTRLEIDRETTNPEADLSALAQSIAGPQGFDYDVLGYRVYGEESSSSYYGGSSNYGRPIYVYDDYLYCNNWGWRYNGCHRWPFDGGLAFGTGFYFGYAPYTYGYGYGFPYGYGGYYPGHTYNNRAPVLVGRPRGYTVRPRNQAIGGAGVFSGDRRNGLDRGIPGIDWRNRARPSSGIGNRAPSGDYRGGGQEIAPPARRSRPEGVDYPTSRGGGREPSASAPRGDGGGRSAPSGRAEPSHRSEPSHSSGGGGHSSGGGGGRSRRP